MNRKISCIRKIGLGSSLCLAALLVMSGCKEDVDNSPEKLYKKVQLKELSQTQKEVLQYIPRNIIIAHRGSTFWGPEETEAAMRWARNSGADYLEVDLQMTSDGYLLCLHDDNLSRTTDIAQKFPGKEDLPANSFTLDELRTLDAGSWFNFESPARARDGFINQDIITLDDLIMIAEGNRILREKDLPGGSALSPAEGNKRVDLREVDFSTIVAQFPSARKGDDGRTIYVVDEEDNGNRPGIYPETKEPWQFPGIEQELKNVLTRHGWYSDDIASLKVIPTTSGLVEIANTPARVILQTFSKESLRNINSVFTRTIPTTMLLWLERGASGGYYMVDDDPVSYGEWINFAIENGATIMGPSVAGRPNNYDELLAPWMAEMIRSTGMHIHGYSFDTDDQMRKYSGVWSDVTGVKLGENRVDGWFTNKTDMSRDFFAITLRDLAAQGRNYILSNAHLRATPANYHMNHMQDNLQEHKELPKAEDVLDQLGY